MKKIGLFTVLIFFFGVFSTTSALRVLSLMDAKIDENINKLGGGNSTSIDVSPNIKTMQELYPRLKDLGFLKLFPTYDYDTQKYGNTQYQEGLVALSQGVPKTPLEKMIYPYVNSGYTKNGSGLFLQELSGGIFQAGAREARGRLIFDIAHVETERKEDYLRSGNILKVYFQIESSPEKQIDKLPYVIQKEDTKTVFLGCGSIFYDKYKKLDIHGVTVLRRIYDFNKGSQQFLKRYVSSPRYQNPEKLKKSEREKMRSNYNEYSEHLQLSDYENQLITMRFYLLPNYILKNQTLPTECENSWLDIYEIYKN